MQNTSHLCWLACDTLLVLNNPGGAAGGAVCSVELFAKSSDGALQITSCLFDRHPKGQLARQGITVLS